MKNINRRVPALSLAVVAMLALLNAQPTTAFAQGTAFTYQGRVTDNGTNFAGTGQFKFALVTSTNYNHQATATANLSGTFVTSYNLISGGSGYASAPTVTVSGGGITGRGQQSQAEIESRALVNKIVAALGGEAAVARVKSTRLKSTRHAKTADGDAVIAVDRIVDYPDRIWMLRKAPQFEATTVVTPADAFTVTAGIVRDLPAAMRQEAARAIKLGVLAIAQHAQDPAYSFAVKGEENVRGLGTAVLEIAVNGDKAIWNVDPSTGRVLRETRIAIGVAGKPSQTSFEYSDWRVVDGVSVPFRIAESG